MASFSSKYFHTQNKFIFPALNLSNNFATIDYDAHITTNIGYSCSHVFKTKVVAESNTLHTICEVERTQLLTQNRVFLLTQNRSILLL